MASKRSNEDLDTLSPSNIHVSKAIREGGSVYNSPKSKDTSSVLFRMLRCDHGGIGNDGHGKLVKVKILHWTIRGFCPMSVRVNNIKGLGSSILSRDIVK
ncbi:hypothetical protein QYM36_010813 [Artemia franciscana]|uniref:Uncharacterized protein n=1 Tax=Artemia franciscana TaxID=6661 RepID=A0AA88HYG0_ARTSF|nr:hypothetical protein QYM36_010813 [Artemia franciscana]